MIQDEDQMMFELKLKASDIDGVDVDVKALYAIYTDYLQNRSLMEQQAEHFARILNHCPEINSVKWRAKDPFHLINKIIRKKKKPDDNPKYANIDISNYKEIVTDLIGLRAIFIFKAHWSLVDEYIFKMLNICPDNTITIYHASDDELTFFPKDSSVKKDGKLTYNYKLEKKESRYRSTHYTLQGEKHTGCKVELQVRSILDEAWGEIDHHIRYPDNEYDPELLRKMSILNGQISGCEEHASQSYVYFTELEASKSENTVALENNSKVTELVENKTRLEDHVQDKKNEKLSEVTNEFFIDSFQGKVRVQRLSKIFKSTLPLRDFEGFNRNQLLETTKNKTKAKEILDQLLGEDTSYKSFGDKTKGAKQDSKHNLTTNNKTKAREILDQLSGEDTSYKSFGDKTKGAKQNSKHNLTTKNKTKAREILDQLSGEDTSYKSFGDKTKGAKQDSKHNLTTNNKTKAREILDQISGEDTSYKSFDDKIKVANRDLGDKKNDKDD